jgi:hypothetical protein
MKENIGVPGLDDWGSVPGTGTDENFSLRHRVQTRYGARPVSFPVNNGGSYPGRETEHSPPCNA